MPTAPSCGNLPDPGTERENDRGREDKIEGRDEDRLEPRLPKCLDDEHCESEHESERDGVVGSEVGQSCDFVRRGHVTTEGPAKKLAERPLPEPRLDWIQDNFATAEAIFLQANFLILGGEGHTFLELVVARK